MENTDDDDEEQIIKSVMMVLMLRVGATTKFCDVGKPLGLGWRR